MNRTASFFAPAIALAIVLSGCGGSGRPAPTAAQPEPSFPPAISPYSPEINPADFVEGVDNEFFPLEPGTTYIYEGMDKEETQTDIVTVTDKTKNVLGVTCTVVRDVVKVDGEIAEFTYDWYAQDRFGNVWYFGEDTKEMENGKVVSREGAWEAGVDGAQAGIIMLGDPNVGDRYRQEYYEGEAEDMAEILDLDTSIAVPAGSFDNVLVTKDWTPLEPSLIENKSYAPGVGVVLEEHVKGPQEVFRLVEIRH